MNFTDAFLNFYESGMRKYFTLIYDYYNKGQNLKFLSNLENQNVFTSRFYTFLCSFANNKQVERVFNSIKPLVVKELVYNQNYWHVKDGYIEEKTKTCPNF